MELRRQEVGPLFRGVGVVHLEAECVVWIHGGEVCFSGSLCELRTGYFGLRKGPCFTCHLEVETDDP